MTRQGIQRLTSLVVILSITGLEACGNFPPTVPTNMSTAVVQTLTASVWTPTVIPTLDPSESKIIEWLNEEFSNADALEQTLDARYQAIDVKFPNTPNSSSILFQVHIRCECSSYNACCLPERIFVVTMWAMKNNHKKILDEVPPNTTEIKIVCFDRITIIGAMSAWWGDARDYLKGDITGFQLGGRAFRSPIP